MDRDWKTIAAAAPRGMFFGGRWSEDGEAMDVLDKYLHVPAWQVTTANAGAVSRAVDGLAEWSRRSGQSPRNRYEALARAAIEVDSHRPDFVQLMAVEAGMTRSDSTTEIDRAVRTLQLCAEEALRVSGDMVPMAATPGAERRLAFTVRVPVGIVCAITPFNSPLNVVLHKVGPALAAGNAVILKPSPHTPLTAALVVRILLESGIDPASIALVHGGGAEVGRYLLEDQRIGFYAFTGSTAVGRAISAGAGIRRTQLELGSIAPTIVARSADMGVALPKIVNASFRKAGQVCTSTQVVYVHAERAAELARGLEEGAAALRVGDPLDQSSTVGPLISPDSVTRIESWIDTATNEGAERLCGGLDGSTTIAPTVMRNVSAGSPLRAQEVFGPVVSVVPVDGLIDAFDMANSSGFGLACGLFTQDLSESLAAIRLLRFGAVHVNETSSARADEMPFGGVGLSGHGHEGPRYAVQQMTEEHLVTMC